MITLLLAEGTPFPPLSTIILSIVTLILPPLLLILYNLTLHPLSSFPGPLSHAATPLPYILSTFAGKADLTALRLHDKYGPVVRIAPNRLSFSDPDAWRHIRGHRRAGEAENPKDPSFYGFSTNNILGVPSREDHGRHRRVLAHGFSAKKMAAQAPLITKYVDLLFEQLKKRAGKEVVDMGGWFNFTTFDVIGDLSFGEPFGCLEEGRLHPWVAVIFDSVRQFSGVVMMKRHLPLVLAAIRAVAPGLVGRAQLEQAAFARRKVEKRIQSGVERPDYIDAMVNAEGEKALAHREIVENARMLVLAGSETTATALTAATFLLATHPEVQRRLAEEVRSGFGSEEEIDLQSVQKLKYMLAVLDESMRVMPPVPGAMPRLCQEGGDVICGKYVPGGTGLDIFARVMFWSKDNFTNPESFIPERWLDDERHERFASDKQDAFQPFSIGPRNCIGKNLAYVEMRLIMARLIWNFDISLADDSGKSWLTDCRAYNLWLKGPLDVKLTPAKRV